MMDSGCKKCSLAFFCSFDKDSGVAPIQHHLQRKESLHLAYDPFTKIYAVRSGALKAYESNSTGNELIRGLYLKNEIYGFDAIAPGIYPFTTVALSKTIVCEVSYSKFLELIQVTPDLLSRILYMMSQQLTIGLYLKYISAQQRLSAFLLDLAKRLSDNSITSSFLLPMSYQDIGDYLGLATETISRILSQFKKHQIISVEHKHISFLQPEKLLSISKGYQQL